ncbi:hypothetical protein [Nostoc linckia]|uniref:hypothetical protein n=1 Tax=Nostoc linckia TaxID=92942 RepID=UPI001C557DD9|nr:hypothetical protein [Nostoc linckia]
MKAVLMTAAGAPEVLQVQDVPNPTVPVGNTELLSGKVANKRASKARRKES